ncbi:phage tail terminator protein [Vibrio alginolyticus]|uniref:phage tail terminator protein n=1 Tax=Vibrio alginolyticus TaxID=663 RepID=UPI004068D9F7
METDLIALTIERLKDQSNGKPPWIDVKEIDSLTQLHEKKSALLRTPALFVFLVSDSPKPDVRGSGLYLQDCVATVGVVIVTKSTNSKPIDWQPLRKELRQRLFGWTPDDEYEPFWLGPGRLMGISNGRADWFDQFITEYTEDQNRYGS